MLLYHQNLITYYVSLKGNICSRNWIVIIFHEKHDKDSKISLRKIKMYLFHNSTEILLFITLFQLFS
jgi:hypothetical protein